MAAARPGDAVTPPESELREAARFLVQHPLVTAEHHADEFRLIRRHRQQLDQWFTQRLGYRLQVSADTARLHKMTVVARMRPLRTATAGSRPFTVAEYRTLALTLAATASGPRLISLADLVLRLREAASEAGLSYGTGATERRALVTVLRWMVAEGIATELHSRVEAYAADEEHDAVLEFRPDRIAVLALPVLSRAESAEQLLDRSEQRRSARSWMRAQLLEDPVLYRSDLDETEWSQLRRRLSEEADFLDEMFGLVLEVRAEGIMAIDPTGMLTDMRFPASGTTGHAALLLVERMAQADDESSRSAWSQADVVAIVSELAAEHRSYWSQLADEPSRLADEALDLLAAHRLVETSDGQVVVLPAAARYRAELTYQSAAML